MAMIQGPGSFGNNQPVGGPKRSREQAPQSEQGTELHVEDGLVLSGSQAPAQEESRVELQPQSNPAETPNSARAPQTAPERRGPQEFEGAFLVGAGVSAGSLGAVGVSNSSAGVSESVFTNGLNSTKLIGISGNVLADASPFRG